MPESKTKQRPPDYRIRVLHKKTEGKATVGAAWHNEDNSISLRLDPCCILVGDPDLVITLFSIEE